MKWPEFQLGTLTDRFISGGTPSTKIPEYWGGSIPWITGADFEDGKVILGRRYINELAVKNSATSIVPKGSILMVTRTGVGKIAIAPEDVAISQDITGIVLKPGIITAFMVSAINSKMRLLLSMQRGATIKGITRNDVAQLATPLPAPSEQRRIVEILDQADALRKKRSKADTKAANILPALFYKMFGDPAVNFKKKVVFPIRQLCEPVERRDPSKKTNEVFKYLDIASVNGATGRILGYRELVGRDAPSRARQIIKTNDVVISTVRPYLRATALIPHELNNEICSTGFCVLRAQNSKGYGFLYALTRLQWFTELLNSMARGASYPAVTDNDILGLSIPYTNDKNIHERFDLMVAEHIDNYNKQRLAVSQKLELLFSTILHRAFSGDLTAKWREAHIKELLAEMAQQEKALQIMECS